TTHEYLSWALIGSNLFKPTARRKNEIEDFIEEGDFNLNRYLKNRILLFPVYHRSALNHGEMYKEIFSIKKTYKRYMPYTAYSNVWGLPALTIPIGFDKNKLPIGIQLISKMEMNYRFLKSENKLKKISVDLFEVLYMINNMTQTYYIKMSSLIELILTRLHFFLRSV